MFMPVGKTPILISKSLKKFLAEAPYTDFYLFILNTSG